LRHKNELITGYIVTDQKDWPVLVSCHGFTVGWSRL